MLPVPMPKRVKARLITAGGVTLLLLGVFLLVVGVMGFLGLYDIDADRSGMAIVGLAYGSLGALLALGGWRLVRRERVKSERV